MKHTKKLLSVLLAALLLTGCFTLAFSAFAAGSAYPVDNVVLLPYDTDGLKDGDWYFDLDTYVADVMAEFGAEGYEITDDVIAAEIDATKKSDILLYDPTSRTIYYLNLNEDSYYYGLNTYRPGDDIYAF